MTPRDELIEQVAAQYQNIAHEELSKTIREALREFAARSDAQGEHTEISFAPHPTETRIYKAVEQRKGERRGTVELTRMERELLRCRRAGTDRRKPNAAQPQVNSSDGSDAPSQAGCKAVAAPDAAPAAPDAELIGRLRKLSMRLEADLLRTAADRIEALARDAERYRFLRDFMPDGDFYSKFPRWTVARESRGMGQVFVGKKLDAAIDAALSERKLP